MKEEKSCGAVTYYKDNQDFLFLLIQHKNGGHWSFPKGHVEKGETEEETALREIKEETGLEVELNNQFRETTRFSPKKDVMKEVVYFMAKANSNKVTRQLEEVSQFLWLPYQEALNKITYSNDKDLLIKAQNFLQ
ncbi:bis(5'-nucleosyl)-tetraphosphatase [Facklamia sp. 7083-14-GEN3]|uniref:bis(5'-nucleosyl)-tetraphosphatase n=1 Tax=Facklamia sp. 7083-14-GEN3 TaxID=2973478 RepID=UPI00215D516B|nr:NUDIX domain-containing protein [Facklamia sp. 7083-14-GEN3]MCR8969949.1 NUDIX domain-containing protein [Facklamia sp. 7083-14-GEN3]